MKESSNRAAAAQPPLRLGVLQDNFGYLMRVMRSIAQQTSPEFIGDLGHMTGQITAMGLIAANAEVSQNDIAHVLQMKKSQVAVLLNDLVSRGLVCRVEREGDRRYNSLTLTDKGMETWKEARMRIRRHSNALLKPLPPQARKDLARLMRQLIAAHLSASGVQIDFEEPRPTNGTGPNANS